MRVAFTREGLRFTLLLAIVGFAAYNNQNNVLYLLLAVGIASVIASAGYGVIALTRLSLAGAEQPDAFADVPFRERLFVRSRSRLLDAFGLEVDSQPSALPFIGASQTAEAATERLFRRRGLYPGSPVELATRFPFGFFRVSRRVDRERTLTVFPRVRPIDPNALSMRRSLEGPLAKKRGQSDEFFGLREYVPGDSQRHIHWKATAKAGRLMVRVFGAADDERLCIGFLPILPPESDPAEFEQLVTAAASLAAHLVRTSRAFRFVAEDLDLAPRSSHAHLRSVLNYLATVAPVGAIDRDFALNLAAAARAGERVLVVALDRNRVPDSDARVIEPRELLPHLSERT